MMERLQKEVADSHKFVSRPSCHLDMTDRKIITTMIVMAQHLVGIERWLLRSAEGWQEH